MRNPGLGGYRSFRRQGFRGQGRLALNKQFIDLLERLFTVYDQGQLSDCDDDTEEKNPVILDRTNLGSLEMM